MVGTVIIFIYNVIIIISSIIIIIYSVIILIITITTGDMEGVVENEKTGIRKGANCSQMMPPYDAAVLTMVSQPWRLVNFVASREIKTFGSKSTFLKIFVKPSLPDDDFDFAAKRDDLHKSNSPRSSKVLNRLLVSQNLFIEKSEKYRY